MLHSILYCVLIFFVLAGVVACVYALMLLIMRPRAVGRFVLVIPPAAKERDVASLLCAARLRMGLLGDISRCEVLALDCGMTEACRKQCEALCMELDHTRVLRPEELLKVLGC